MKIRGDKVMAYLNKAIIIFVGLYITGCSTISEVKAPCDYQGHLCGQKISINH